MTIYTMAINTGKFLNGNELIIRIDKLNKKIADLQTSALNTHTELEKKYKTEIDRLNKKLIEIETANKNTINQLEKKHADELNKLKKVKIGMHKTDVAILLGNSLITPTFQKNRWDYVFTYQIGEGPILVKRATIFFAKDQVTQIIKVPNE